MGQGIQTCANGQVDSPRASDVSRLDLLKQTERNIRTLASMEDNEAGDAGVAQKDTLGDPQTAQGALDWYSEILQTIAVAVPGVGAPSGIDKGNANDFLNSIMRSEWVHFATFLRDEIVNTANPKLEQKIGHGAHLSKDLCTFGDRPPFFRDVRLVSQAGGSGGEASNLIFRCDVDWEATESHFDLEISGHKLGIEKITFKGVMFFEAVQMLERKPLFEGARLYFLDPPEITFDFEGKVSILSDIPMIRPTILHVLQSKVADIAVAPHMLGGVLSKEFDIFRIKHPRPRGLLQLVIWHAKGLPATDRSLASFGKKTCGHPCVEVKCGGQALKSEKHSNTSNPIFGGGQGFCAHLVLFRASEQRITIEAHDEHMLGKPTLLGSIRLAALGMIGWSSEDDARKPSCKKVSLELIDQHSKEGVGSVCLSAAWRPIVDDPRLDCETDRFWVSMGVYSASHVPMDDARTVYWVTMACDCIHAEWHQEPGGPVETPRKKLVIIEDKVDAKTRNQKVDAKIEVLRKYKMPEEDMAKILGIEVSALQKRDTGESHNGDARTIHWEHAVDFLISDVEKATCTFVLWCRSPGAKADRELGRLVRPVASVAAADAGRSPDPALPVAAESQMLSRLTPRSKNIAQTSHVQPEAPGHSRDMGDAAPQREQAEAADTTLIHSEALAGSDITLKVRVQLRYLGKPTPSISGPDHFR